uniref:hypothetical protein n=1 Tax=Mycobacterium marinum TaxID=1781 RepID=UPI0035662390
RTHAQGSANDDGSWHAGRQARSIEAAENVLIKISPPIPFRRRVRIQTGQAPLEFGKSVASQPFSTGRRVVTREPRIQVDLPAWKAAMPAQHCD